jgi:uncharacterized protein
VNPVFIIDTNVVVAGLITAKAVSPVAVALDGMLRPDFRFVISDALLAEYRAVLTRPKLVKAHQLSEAEIDILLAEIAQNAIVLKAVASVFTAPDSGDQFLWDLLTSRDDLILVTGDKLLLQDGPLQDRLMTPADFVRQRN